MRDPYQLTGRVFADRYELVAFSGLGGMGAVYRAVDRSSNNVVAVKILKPDILELHPDYRNLFTREVRAAQNLDHPNIVKVLDSGTTEDEKTFMVMEWLEGMTLAEAISREKLSLERVQNIFSQICHAVAHAHSQRIIHLDLKPANVFLVRQDSPSDYAKVIDFGMAKILSSDSGTTVTRFLGTYQYCSPEHFGGKVSNRSDVYSLGVTLYEMLTGTIPFGSSYIHAKLHGLDLPPLRSIHSRPNLPKTVDRVIARALEKNPAARPGSVIELWNAFNAVLENPVNNVDARSPRIWLPRIVVLLLIGAILLGVGLGYRRWWTKDQRAGVLLSNKPQTQSQEINGPSDPSGHSAHSAPSGTSSPVDTRKPVEVNPQSTTKTVTVRLSPVYFLSGRRMQSLNMPVTLSTGAYKKTQLVGGTSSVTFNSVPCGGAITLVISDNSYNDGLFPPKTLRRVISCEKPSVDFGEVEVSKQ